MGSLQGCYFPSRCFKGNTATAYFYGNFVIGLFPTEEVRVAALDFIGREF